MKHCTRAARRALQLCRHFPNPEGLDAAGLKHAASQDAALAEVLEVSRLFQWLLPGLYHQPRLLSRPAMNPPRLHLEAIPRNTARLEVQIVPPQLYGLPLGEIGGAALRLLDEDFTLPAALVRDDILRHNSTWMLQLSALSGGANRASRQDHDVATALPAPARRRRLGLTAATPAICGFHRRHGVPAFSMPTSSSAAPTFAGAR